MKKFLISLGLLGILGGIITITSASNSSYKEVEFSNGVTAQLEIKDAGTDRRELVTEVDGGSTSNLKCTIMTPDSGLRSLSTCNGEFTYDGEDPGRIKIRIRYYVSGQGDLIPTDREGKPSNSSTRTYPQWVYDRNNEERAEDDLNDYEDNNDETEVTELAFTNVNPDDPEEDEEVDVTVEAWNSDEDPVDEYRGNIRFKVEVRDDVNNERDSASTSDYDLDRTSYTFTSSDDGEYDFNGLVTFLDDNEDYRLVVYDNDDDNIDVGYQVFDFGNGYDEDDDDDEDDNETDSFYVTTSTSSPDENQYVDITVVARDSNSTNEDYRGTVRFKVERKSGSSRVSATSTYYTLSRTSYTFTSSDGGEHEFTDLVRFKNDNYDYRLMIYDDTNDIEEYKTFYLNTTDNNDDDEDTNYDTDNFTVTTDDTTPAKNQYVDLTITAKDGSSKDTSYRGTVEFEVRYKTSGSSQWYKTTSLSDYEMKYTYEDNGYRFSSSNAGQVTITDFIRFRKEGYQYKVVVVDNDDEDVDGEKIFTIGSTDDNDNNNTEHNFYLTTDDTTPSTNQRIDLTIKARDNLSTYTSYRGTMQFEVYYKASGSSTWTKTTSSTYYEMAGSYEDDGYTFTSSNAGEKSFTNLIRFKKNNYSYKVLVYDEDEDNDFQGEKTFTVGSTSDDSDVDGYTASQLNTVESIYDARRSMITNLKSIYPRLRTHTTRQNKSDDLYAEMKKILDDSSTKAYDDFDAFSDAWSEWYRYTISVR